MREKPPITWIWVLCFCSLVLAGCQHPSAKPSASGAGHAFIYSETSGRIEKFLVTPGQTVKPGDLVMQLEVPAIPAPGCSSVGDSVVNELAHLASQIQSGMSASVGQDEVSLAYLTALEVIAHNLANVNTTGFKRMRVQFQELLGGTNPAPGSALPTGEPPLGGRLTLRGARATCATRIFSTGDLTQTGESLDLAIKGDGFFELMMPDGRHAYTRDGAFRISSDHHFVTSDGSQLQCGFLSIKPGTTSISISASGQATFSDPQGTTSSQLQLCKFANPAGLEAIGRNLYRETVASGPAELGNPNENGFGELAQGFLELSNVKVAEELVDLIRIQRAYEVYSKATAMKDKLRAQVSLSDF